MNKLTSATILFHLILLLTSCAVPSHVTYADKFIIGTREGASSVTKAVIERRTKITHSKSIVSPDGHAFGADVVTDQSYDYFLVNHDGSEQKLSHLSLPSISYSYLENIVSLAGTTIWIAFRLDENGIRRNLVDIHYTVFNEDLILSQGTVKDCIRIKTGDWDLAGNYSIIPQNGNHEILFETKNGKRSYHVQENKFY